MKNILPFYLFALMLLTIYGKGNTQETSDKEQLLSALHDLALEGVICYEEDIRIRPPFGHYKAWDYTMPVSGMPVKNHSEYTAPEAYFSRTQGIRRQEIYSLDEIGRIFNKSMFQIAVNGPGNSLLESMWICKKYGIRPGFYIPPSTGAVTGCRAEDFNNYRQKAYAEVKEKYEYFKKLESQFGIPMLGINDYLWFFWGGGIRGAIHTAIENPDRFNDAFRTEHDFNIQDMTGGNTPREIAQRRLFIRWLRKLCFTVNKINTEVFRDIFGQAGKTVSNIHSEGVIDYEVYGDTYDYPGPAARPYISDHEIVYIHWTGYIFRLWNDLTDKTSAASCRMNLMSVGNRVVPTPSAMRYAYAKAVQNGAMGFYHYIMNYEGKGIGNSFANPDRSALPQLRWENIQKISKIITRTKRFVPPQSETGIFICIDACNKIGWQRIFSAYAELTKSRVWANFISDSEILNGSESFRQYKMVFIPVMDYTRESVVNALRDYIKDGGIAVIGDPAFASYNMHGESMQRVREEICGSNLGVKNEAAGRIRFQLNGERFEFDSGPFAHTLDVQSGAKIIGRYADGSPAVVEHKLGKGKVLYFGCGLLDIFHRLNGKDESSTKDRYRLLKQLEQINDVADNGWIFDITLDNIQQVTGALDIQPPSVDESIILD